MTDTKKTENTKLSTHEKVMVILRKEQMNYTYSYHDGVHSYSIEVPENDKGGYDTLFFMDFLDAGCNINSLTKPKRTKPMQVEFSFLAI